MSSSPRALKCKDRPCVDQPPAQRGVHGDGARRLAVAELQPPTRWSSPPTSRSCCCTATCSTAWSSPTRSSLCAPSTSTPLWSRWPDARAGRCGGICAWTSSAVPCPRLPPRHAKPPRSPTPWSACRTTPLAATHAPLAPAVPRRTLPYALEMP